MARSRSPTHDESESTQPDLKKLKNKFRYRIPYAQIRQYARDGVNYLIPHAYCSMTYQVNIGNPSIGKERFHRIRFWQDKFRFNLNGEKQVWKLDEPQSIPFLKSLKEHKLPDVFKRDGEDVVHVIQAFRRGERGCSGTSAKKEDQQVIEPIKGGLDTSARKEEQPMIEPDAESDDDGKEPLDFTVSESDFEEGRKKNHVREWDEKDYVEESDETETETDDDDDDDDEEDD
ncbi:hypothetical protein ACHQM5_004003 [Ranunculus cassubicifolius]